MESKQRPQSVIASLMGLDEMPPRQPINRQQRVLSENYFQKIASIGVREKQSTSEGPSFRMSIYNQPEFRNIFEVPQTSMLEKDINQPVQKGKPTSNLNTAKLSPTREKFMDVNCFSFDEKFQHLKESHDTVELIFKKDPMLGNSEMKTTRGNNKNIYKKLSSEFSENFHRKLGGGYSPKLLKCPLESKEEIPSCPTRIVVLKPNAGKAQENRGFGFLSGSYDGSESCDRRDKVCSSGIERSDSAVGERRKVDNNMEFSKHNFRAPRELAKEITRHNIWGRSTYVSKSGCSGDEASADESELAMPSCDASIDWDDQCRNSFYYSNEQSIDRESKKRVSERWKTTKRYQEVGLCSSGTSTALAEMLAAPNHETRSSLNFKHGLKNRCSLLNEDRKFGSPRIDSLARSRSIPASSNTAGNSKPWIRREALPCEWCLRPEEALHGNKSRRQNFDQKRSSCKSTGPSARVDIVNNEMCTVMRRKHVWRDLTGKIYPCPKLPSCDDPCVDSQNCVGHEAQLIVDYLNKTSEKGCSKNNSMVPKSSISSVASIGVAVDRMADTETEDVGLCSESTNGQQSELVQCTLSLKDGESSSGALDSSNPQETSFGLPGEGGVGSQCLMMGTEHPGSSDEAYQPSPVSVWDPLLKDENSSGSECFESLSSDLCGLQMQLQLLESKSTEAYSDGAEMAVSSDGGVGEGSVGLLDECRQLAGFFRVEGNRDFSYLVDVLVEAGSHDGTWDLGFETWHSPECPLSPLVFKALEKKYEEDESWGRSKRRLLFDRINLGLLEIFQSCVSMNMHAMPMRKWFRCSQWSQEAVEEQLWTLLVSQATEASTSSSEKVFGRDMRWLEMGDEINVIGRELERFLIDELAAEFAMNSHK